MRLVMDGPPTQTAANRSQQEGARAKDGPMTRDCFEEPRRGFRPLGRNLDGRRAAVPFFTFPYPTRMALVGPQDGGLFAVAALGNRARRHRP